MADCLPRQTIKSRASDKPAEANRSVLVGRACCWLFSIVGDLAVLSDLSREFQVRLPPHARRSRRRRSATDASLRTYFAPIRSRRECRRMSFSNRREAARLRTCGHCLLIRRIGKTGKRRDRVEAAFRPSADASSCIERLARGRQREVPPGDDRAVATRIAAERRLPAAGRAAAGSCTPNEAAIRRTFSEKRRRGGLARYASQCPAVWRSPCRASRSAAFP